MTGKTHAAVGLGTVLAVTQPSTVSGLVLAAGTGMLGALISDIDVGTSKSHKDADQDHTDRGTACGSRDRLELFL